MSAPRGIRPLLLATLVALAAALAAAALPASATAAPRIDGKALTDCSGRRADAFSLFTRAIGCRRALGLAVDAAVSDRLCPRGWKGREGVRVDGLRNDSGVPARLALCARTVERGRGRRVKQLFVYHFAAG